MHACIRRGILSTSSSRHCFLMCLYIEAYQWNWNRKCTPMGIPVDQYLTPFIIISRPCTQHRNTEMGTGYKHWENRLNWRMTRNWRLIIEKVNKLKYLQSVIQSDGRSFCEIERRVREARKLIGMLNTVLWRKTIHWSCNHMLQRLLK